MHRTRFVAPALLALIPLLAATTAHAEHAPHAIDESVRAHLAHVETTLRQQDTSHLTPAQRAARTRHLDTLRAYWQAGIFPRNTASPSHRIPVFIDDDGRSCAVAHLMMADGHADAAYAIADRENLAYVPDMTSPELARWLPTTGLTAQEAAWIQPSYPPECACDRTPNPVCSTKTNVTYVNACTAVECDDRQHGLEAVGDLVTGCCGADAEMLVISGGMGWSAYDRDYCPNNFNPNATPQPITYTPQDEGDDAPAVSSGDDESVCTIASSPARTPSLPAWRVVLGLIVAGFVVARRRR